MYGFISIQDSLLFSLLDHRYFQRLGRISQGGLSYLVYPGAHHTRFHHALGAMHLMGEAMQVLRQKGIEISDEEQLAAKVAILLHDIGHGPFSHTLEGKIWKNISHEEISLHFMQLLAQELHHSTLDMALEIFSGSYPRKFIHQLVSGQLDTDRLDYLMRDSFFTGVAEGIIGSERIIKMMHVNDDRLVIEEKGIYSVEKFLIARRLMYWQVYLHKTVLGAEILLIHIMNRAFCLFQEGQPLFLTTALQPFFHRQKHDISLLEPFSQLDDHDIFVCIKEWSNHTDKILADLCNRLLHRRLFKIRMQTTPFDEDRIADIRGKISRQMNLSDAETDYYMHSGSVKNTAYDTEKDEILILMKSGEVMNIFEASMHLESHNMQKEMKRYYLCIPKEVQIN